jgi:hypothetical protein
MYTLKPNAPAFDVVDGPLAGRQYRHGQTYTEIPTDLAGRFDTITPGPAPTAMSAPVSKAGKSKEAAPATEKSGGE